MSLERFLFQRSMIRISITTAAFDAISATLPLGSVGFEPEVDTKGERWIWLEDAMVDRLATMRAPARATATRSCGSSRSRRPERARPWWRRLVG